MGGCIIMKSCGVIVEYNPFHNGHRYHIQQARLKSGADVVIAVMSGNFLQRGEPALLDKWARAEMALAAGIDIIVELPVYSSVQAADYFAEGGIALLHALQCDSFCFGSENGEEKDFQQVAKWLIDEKETFDQAFQMVKNSGSSYAAQVEALLKEVYPTLSLNLSEPNNALGLSYVKANLAYQKPMEMYTIKREKAGYHETTIQDLEFASATAIRKSLIKKESTVESVMPASSLKLINQEKFVSWENYWQLLRYQIMVSTVDDLQQIYQMNEGIEFRLKEKVKEAETFTEFIGLVKNKRYTWTRIQRLCIYILLQLKKTDVEASVEELKAIRVLGFTEQGRSYLKAKKTKIELPIVTNLNAANKNFFDLDIRAGFIYQLGNPHISPQDYRRKPIYQIKS